jgi:hypothetical protein
MDYNEEEYRLMDSIELSLLKLKKQMTKLRKDVDHEICINEVEDFLFNGPGGIDPN